MLKVFLLAAPHTPHSEVRFRSFSYRPFCAPTEFVDALVDAMIRQTRYLNQFGERQHLAVAFVPHSAISPMFPHMVIVAAEHFKIVGMVISFIPINMMHNLVLRERSADFFFRNHDMLKYISIGL